MLYNINLTQITTSQGIQITPGGYITAAGDVNNDGYSDFLINTYDTSYLIWGNDTNWHNIELTSIMLLDGIKISSSYGIAMSIGVGDVNNDQYNDVLISSPSAGALYEGITYLLFGKSTGWTNIDLNDFTSSDGIQIYGASYLDYSGYFISKLGDINGDTYNDFLIGTFNAISYLLFGKPTGWTNIDLNDFTSSQGIIIQGTSNIDSSGDAITGDVDINNDGFSDFLISVESVYSDFAVTYIIWGKETGWQDINLTNATFHQGVQIYQSYPYVSGTGDINNDGYDDFIIDGTDIRTTYLLFGSSTNWHNINLDNFDSSYGVKIQGASYYYYSGIPVKGLGDINNDGYGDFAIGASITGTANDGTIYIFLGKNGTWENVDLSSFNYSHGIQVDTGSNVFSVSNTGDVNGDGYDDFLVGATYGQTSTTSYLIFGGEVSSSDMNSSAISSTLNTPAPISNSDNAESYAISALITVCIGTLAINMIDW